MVKGVEIKAFFAHFFVSRLLKQEKKRSLILVRAIFENSRFRSGVSIQAFQQKMQWGQNLLPFSLSPSTLSNCRTDKLTRWQCSVVGRLDLDESWPVAFICCRTFERQITASPTQLVCRRRYPCVAKKALTMW